MKNRPETAAQPHLEFNVEFDETVRLAAEEQTYAATPMVGVERIMFERLGGEVVRRATSVVRYQPESYFESHVHAGGEEFITLNGVFSDENGDYPKGVYVRNPVSSTHRPHSKEGCEIFVKLAQMPDSENHESFILDTNAADWQINASGIASLQLWKSEYEDTQLIRLTTGSRLVEDVVDEVAEYFVLDGDLQINDETFTAHSWVRFKPHSRVILRSDNGATLYRKIGKGFVRR
ncbi:cupin domain-containing protein [Vibrio penaeicida]|uniref:ChrR-like cupin domain-containing protein n=1 Tax=Vibrio penaeicida TaxID=104609 RepID=A0AAV5NZB7_9VIBR|nr:cupin domain-containing protein [Vibrio penaeicida]RTZ19219.1 anti-sigma factor [Vibrio penaeicida]GLQ75717.1 hypothetical protein GCM10007932_50800 [Vibrio penaeicida]